MCWLASNDTIVLLQKVFPDKDFYAFGYFQRLHPASCKQNWPLAFLSLVCGDLANFLIKNYSIDLIFRYFSPAKLPESVTVDSNKDSPDQGHSYQST